MQCKVVWIDSNNSELIKDLFNGEHPATIELLGT